MLACVQPPGASRASAGVNVRIKSFLSVVGFATLTTLLSACETVDYMAISDQQLCMGYLTLPDTNIWQSDREAAIRARGIDCSQYAQAAQAKVRANQNLEQSLRALGGENYSNEYSKSCYYKSEYTSGLNKMCFYDCMGSTKSTNISAAAICPTVIQM